MINKFKIFLFIFFLFLFLYPIPYTLYPTHAQVDLKEVFGFGDIENLGQGVDRLVTPAFSIATTLIIFYFLFGAFKILKSAGEKEEIEAAREMITHAIIGFIILMAAFLILQFLLGNLFSITDLKIIEGL